MKQFLLKLKIVVMEIALALVLYLLILIAVYFMARHARVRRASAIALALIVAIVFLGLMYPYPRAADVFWPRRAYRPSLNISIVIYALYILITWIYLIWYIFTRVMNDIEPHPFYDGTIE